MNRPEFELKERLREAGVQIRDVAAHLNIPYGTLASQLNGFAPLKDRKKIDDLLQHTKSAHTPGAAA